MSGTEPVVILPRSLALELLDDSPSRFDHDGDCQAHGWTLEPGEVCGNEVLRRLIDEQAP